MMYSYILWVIVFNWWIIGRSVNGQTYEEMDQLYKNLFNDTYNINVRPLISQSDKIQIAVSHSLLSMEHFVIQTGVLSIAGHFVISWKDEFLSWNPSDYGNRSMIHVRKEQIWVPKITCSNGPTRETVILSNQSFSPVWVSHTGDVIMTVDGVYETICYVDVSIYPFDSQNCTFALFSSAYMSSELSFHLPLKNIQMDKFEPHHEWSVEKTDISSTVESVSASSISVPKVSLSIVLKRRVSFYAINIQVPLFLLAILQISGVFVPVSSGERISYSMTIYIGVVFMMISVWESIPNHSLRMPMICMFVISYFIVFTLEVISHLFVIRLSNMSSEDFEVNVPNMMKTYARFLKRKKQTKRTPPPASSFSTKVEPIDDTECDSDSISIQDANTDDENSDTNEEVTGLDVAIAVDKSCFVLVVLYSIISVSLFLIITLHRA